MDNGYFRYNREMAGYIGFPSYSFVIPTRITFAFDLQGPSTHMNSGCSLGLTVIETAVNSIKLGIMNAAVVTNRSAWGSFSNFKIYPAVTGQR